MHVQCNVGLNLFSLMAISLVVLIICNITKYDLSDRITAILSPLYVVIYLLLSMLFPNMHSMHQMTMDFCMILSIAYRTLIHLFEKFKYKEFIKIDGSFGEGGGQIIRNSMAYAAILRKPIFIYNIRAGRAIPGLRDQHTTGIALVYKICSNIDPKQSLVGNYKTSTNLKYFVGNDVEMIDRDRESHYFINSNSKASIALIIQTCLPILLYLPHKSCVRIIGGTNASAHAPHIDYLQCVVQPMLCRLMKLNIDIRCNKRGYLSTNGGGECILKVDPIKSHLNAFDLTNRGNKISTINGIVIVHTNVDQIHDMAQQVVGFIKSKLQIVTTDIDIQIEVDIHDVASESTTFVLQLFAETDTKCLFGAEYMQTVPNIALYHEQNSIKINILKEEENHEDILHQMSENVCNELLNDYHRCNHSCVDQYLQDQLIIFMALAKGTSRIIISSLEQHTKTAIHFAHRITGAIFHIQKYDKTNPNDCALLVECQGVGVENQFL
eukprot:3506_1